MKNIEEKTIIIQTKININFFANFIKSLNLNPNEKISDFFKKCENSINWDKSENYALLNQGVILSSLYGLIVYPKEKFFDNIPKIDLNKLDINEWGNIKNIIKCPNKHYN